MTSAQVAFRHGSIVLQSPNDDACGRQQSFNDEVMERWDER